MVEHSPHVWGLKHIRNAVDIQWINTAHMRGDRNSFDSRMVKRRLHYPHEWVLKHQQYTNIRAKYDIAHMSGDRKVQEFASAVGVVIQPTYVGIAKSDISVVFVNS